MRVRFGINGGQRGMRQQTDHLTTREAPERQLEQQSDGFGVPAVRGEATIYDIERNTMRTEEHAFDLRQVLIADALGNHDRDLVEAQWRRGAFVGRGAANQPP